MICYENEIQCETIQRLEKKIHTMFYLIVISEMLDVIPLPSGCPMTTTRKGRKYIATVARGGAISLQGDKSDVKLQINKGCPKRAYLMKVKTDLSSFDSIPDDECFISPIVEVLAPAETSTSSYTLRIPHCLDEDDDRSKVKVRMIHENRNPAVPPVEVPKGNGGTLYYTINNRFIELHTTHFTTIICTICQNPYHCRGRISNFWFANFETEEKKVDEGLCLVHDVEIRPYFGGVLHATVDFTKVFKIVFCRKFYFQYICTFLLKSYCLLYGFSHILYKQNIFVCIKQNVEATVNLRYVTKGILKRSSSGFNPESSQIKFSLKVPDIEWKPRQGFDKWDQDTRTFTEVGFFLQTITNNVK